MLKTKHVIITKMSKTKSHIRPSSKNMECFFLNEVCTNVKHFENVNVLPGLDLFDLCVLSTSKKHMLIRSAHHKCKIM